MKYKILIFALLIFAGCEKEVIHEIHSPTPPDIWGGVVLNSGSKSEIINFTGEKPDAVIVTPIGTPQVVTVESAEAGVIVFNAYNLDGTKAKNSNFYYQIIINEK